MTADDIGAEAETEPHRVRSRLLLLVGCVAIAGLGLLTLPGIGDVRERLSSAAPGWIALAGACSLASALGFVLALWAAFDRLMPLPRAATLGFAEQGANVLLPSGGVGGPALGTLVMRRAGVPARFAAERHAVVFLATSLVSFLALVLAGLLVASGALPGDVSPVGTLLPAVVGIAILAGATWVAARPLPAPGAGRIRRAIRPAVTLVHGGARTTLRLLWRRDHPWLVVGAIAYFAFDVGALAMAFAAVGGGGPPLGLFVLAYALGHAGALIPTPGGLGGTEGGLIAMFTIYGAAPDVATAAVLGYRIFQLGLPAVLGAVALLRIRRRLSAGPDTEEVAARFAGVEG
ncbi:MAG: flippase-like protein [Solirubrobacterales bacterium]|nr:flippase-like protein [Solirubrobacterales bacterium]